MMTLAVAVLALVVIGRPVGAQNATSNTSQTAAPPPADAPGALQWYDILAMAVVGFLLLAAAFYATLMWQQSAVRNYRSAFEDVVKQVTAQRRQLAKEIQLRKTATARASSDTAPSAPSEVSVPKESDEERHRLLRKNEYSEAYGRKRAPEERAAVAAADTVPASGGRELLSHRFRALNLRSAPTRTANEEQAAVELEQLVRRKTRQNVARSDSDMLSGASLLAHAVVDATTVDRSLSDMERRMQWRSLRSLNLSHEEAPSLRAAQHQQPQHNTTVSGAVSDRATSYIRSFASPPNLSIFYQPRGTYSEAGDRSSEQSGALSSPPPHRAQSRRGSSLFFSPHDEL